MERGYRLNVSIHDQLSEKGFCPEVIMNSRPEWDGFTRILHWGLTLCITFQLFTGLFVSAPNTLRYFHWHEYGGLTAAAVILLHWIWSFTIRDLGVLFPWNPKAFKHVKEEAMGLLRGHIPAAGRQAGLSSFIHGFGLLAMSGMAVTGVFLFVFIPVRLGGMDPSTAPAAITALSVIHGSLSYVAWTYWVGHVGFAILHQLRGNRVFGAIYLSGREQQ